MTDEAYVKNLGAFTEDELERLRRKSVCIVGCGGLGGYVANALVRFGIGALTLIDGDVFTESNLNRQLFAFRDTIGRAKALVCVEQLRRIAPGLEIRPVCEMLEPGSAERLLRGHDLIIDALDSIKARLLLEETCQALEIPFVHGAVSGFQGQAALVLPGDALLKRLYSGPAQERLEPNGNLAFTVSAVAALESCEAVKYLSGRPEPKHGELLHIDLEHNMLVSTKA